MKRIRSFIVLSSVLITLFAVGASAQKSKQQLTGHALEQKIYKEIIKLPYYGVFDVINFRVDGTVVTLDGKVASLGTKSSAASAVKRIPGVTRVVNNIDNLPPSSFDDRIRRTAYREFSNSGLSRYLWENDPDVRIIVENGRITLEGYVSSNGDRNRFNILANGIPGVFNVTNNIQIGSSRYRS